MTPREAFARAIYALNPEIQSWDGDPYLFHEPGARRRRELAYKQADACLAAKGFTTIDLAEPVEIDGNDDQLFEDGSAAASLRTYPGSGVVYHGGWEWTYQEAREVARQWLSAAEVAGVNTREQETIGIS